MGGCNCSCLRKNQEDNNEMFERSLPVIGKGAKKNVHVNGNLDSENDIFDNNNINTENNLNNSLLLKKQEKNKDIKLINKNDLSINDQEKSKQCNSSILSMIQDLCDSIFDYFNEIRTNPKDFMEEAKKHGIEDIFQAIINSKNPCKLVENSSFNLLSSCNSKDEEDNKKILEMIEKEKTISKYNKKLFVFEGEINNQKEALWNLIEKNKSIAYETFFSNNIEYLAISCKIKDDNNKFKCYFLLLSKKN